jgi:hypothetical protein
MTREWFTTYCQNVAANVLDKDKQVRFTYEQLKVSLDAVNNHCPPVNPVLTLFANIVELCNHRNGEQKLSENDEYALLLTLLNTHAAYLMVSGLWKQEPIQSEGVDEYGFEIF